MLPLSEKKKLLQWNISLINGEAVPTTAELSLFELP